jgi:hypothetical protein
MEILARTKIKTLATINNATPTKIIPIGFA